LALLDRFCGKAIADVLPLLAAQLSRYRAANRELKALQGDGDSRARQIEEWQHALDEIAAADVKPGEEDSLAAERTRLASLEQLQAAATGALAALDGEGGAADTASRALSHAATIAKLDEDSAVLHTNLVDAHAALTDATSEIRAYLDRLDADPHRLGELEERLEALYRLKRKYSTTADGLLKKRDEFEAKLAALTDSDAQISRLKAERKVASHEITALCDKLHAARTAAAAEIGGKISEILADLGMANARFSIEITRSTTFTANGNCTAEFMISTNPGEPVKPLRRIASGGEMSRVMLAVKTVMADADAVPTVIFDEVDTGVSGRTAQQVAEKLATVSRRRQILCITHLPQIAAMADTHFLIQKNAAQDRTITSVQPLNPTDITAELARLIGGVQITTATKNAAQEMKQQANQIKVELK
jgi:DNA repair protein RecN (Recombination protein N)